MGRPEGSEKKEREEKKRKKKKKKRKRRREGEMRGKVDIFVHEGREYILRDISRVSLPDPVLWSLLGDLSRFPIGRKKKKTTESKKRCTRHQNGKRD